MKKTHKSPEKEFKTVEARKITDADSMKMT